MKTRDRILDTADRLFYQNGIRAVGIDTIISEAGIAKATLYNHFPSKTDLIKGYLENRNCQLSEEFDIENLSIIEFFEKIFDYLIRMPHCAFISAMSEFTNENDEVRKAAISYKKLNFDLFKYLAEKENLREPDNVANQLMVISSGLTIQRQIFGKDFDTEPVMELVKMVIKNNKKKLK